MQHPHWHRALFRLTLLPAPPPFPALPFCPCRYKTWSEAVTKAPASVVVLYASDYGFSDRLSQVRGCARHAPCWLVGLPQKWQAGWQAGRQPLDLLNI